jgi:hypothetical protein
VQHLTASVAARRGRHKAGPRYLAGGILVVMARRESEAMRMRMWTGEGVERTVLRPCSGGHYFVACAAPADECQASTLGNNFITTGHARPQVKSLLLAPRALLIILLRLTRKALCLPSSAFFLVLRSSGRPLFAILIAAAPRPPRSAALPTYPPPSPSRSPDLVCLLCHSSPTHCLSRAEPGRPCLAVSRPPSTTSTPGRLIR